MTIKPDQFTGLFDTWELFFDEAFNNVRYNQPSANPFPPADIIEDKNGDYLIVNLAVAGFSKDNIVITVEDSTIIIKGNKEDKLPDNETYTKKTLKTSNFERKYTIKTNHFNLDSISSSLKDGILSIRLERNPDSKKTVEIK